MKWYWTKTSALIALVILVFLHLIAFMLLSWW